MTRIVNRALTEVMNHYGTKICPVLDHRGLLWESDLRGVLCGVVPESCPATEVLDRLVNWAAVLNLALVGPDDGIRGVFTYRGVVEHRPVEVRGTVKPQHVTWISRSLAGARMTSARHRRRGEPDHAQRLE